MVFALIAQLASISIIEIKFAKSVSFNVKCAMDQAIQAVSHAFQDSLCTVIPLQTCIISIPVNVYLVLIPTAKSIFQYYFIIIKLS